MMDNVTNMIPMLIILGCMGINLLFDLFILPLFKEKHQQLVFWVALFGIVIVLGGFLVWYTNDIGWWIVSDCGDMCNVTYVLC